MTASRNRNGIMASGPDVIIRAAELADAAGISQLYAAPHAYADTLQLPFPTQAQWQQRLAQANEQQRSLVAERDGRIVGQLTLTTMERHRRKHVATLGLAVSAECRRQGVASRLLSAALELCDQWLAIRRVELTVYSDNDAAITLYRKFGFIIEGEHKAYAFRNGDYVDACTMARLRNA